MRPSVGVGMAARKLRNDTQQEAILTLIAERYRAGQTQVQIAMAISELLGQPYSRQQVSEYMPRLLAQWRTQAGIDFGAKAEQELAKLDALEATAMADYERSKLPAVTVVRQKGGRDGGKVVTTRDEQTGDPRFLTIAQSCIAERCKLMGLYPQEVPASNPALPQFVIREMEVRLTREPLAS